MENAEIIELAIRKLDERENRAPESYRQLLTSLATGGTYPNQLAKCAELLALMAAAGLGLADLRRDWAELTKPVVRNVNIAAGMHFGPTGMRYESIYVDDLVRSAGGARVDLSAYQIVKADGQTDEDVDDLLQVLRDFNLKTKGDSDEGVKLLRSAKVGGGYFSTGEAAKKIAARFPLWRIRLAVIEAGIIKARTPSEKLSDMVLRRLGLGGLVEPTFTGDHSPQTA
jgi:hypothetical protein